LGFYVKYDINSYVHIPSTSPDCTTRPFVCEYGDTIIGSGMVEIVPDAGLTAYVSGTIPPHGGPYATLKKHRTARSMKWVPSQGVGGRWMPPDICA
jgi:hypothetical protein